MRLDKSLILIAIPLLLMQPEAARADDEADALEACSAAFIRHLSETIGPANYRFVPSPREPFSTEDHRMSVAARVGDKYLLTATRRETGKVVARSACSPTRTGVQLAAPT